MRPTLLIPLTLPLTLLCAGCARNTDPERPALPVGTPVLSGIVGQDPATDAVTRRLADLDAKIVELETRLHTPQRKSTGALAGGPRLRIEGSHQEALLDRLRRLEKDLATAQATITAKEARIHNLEISRADLTATSTDLTQRNDYLSRTQQDLTTAQQALAERQERIGTLEAQVAASELARLRAEREHYLLAAEILRLPPDQPAGLPDLQGRVRDQARSLLPGNTP